MGHVGGAVDRTVLPGVFNLIIRALPIPVGNDTRFFPRHFRQLRTPIEQGTDDSEVLLDLRLA